MGERSVRESHAGQHRRKHRRAARESLCGASRRYRIRTRTLPAARRWSIIRIADPVCSIENCAPMTGSRTPDFSSGISSLHCHRGISGSWFHSSLVAAPMTVVLVRSKRLVLTTGISPPAKPTTSNRPSRASERSESVNRSPPTGSTITSTPRPSVSAPEPRSHPQARHGEHRRPRQWRPSQSMTQRR